MLELNQVYQGDCLEVMKNIDDESIDLIVTSPPYDNLRTYKQLIWSKEIWQNIIKELYRVTKEGGVVVWVVADATIKGSETGTSFKQALWAMECGFNLHDTMIYEKDSCSFPETNRYYSYFEYMFILSKGKPKTCNQIADKPNRRANEKKTGTHREVNGTLKQLSAVKNNTKRKIKQFGVRGNVWRYQVGKWKTTSDVEAYKHPAIFPDQLAHDHIISWSNSDDLVLDPMSGSGTVGKVAMDLGRNYILIEKEPEYVEICKKRLGKSNIINFLFK